MSSVANQFKTVLLLGALTGVLLFVGNVIGGAQGLTFAIIFAVIMNFGSYFFSDKIVLAMHGAKEVTHKSNPKLFDLVKEVALMAEIPMPKVYIVHSPTPNAFATGRNPDHAAVACTQGILDVLSHDELKGVIAHEIAHIKNRDILIATIAATIAGVISYVAAMARWAAIFGGVGNRDRNGGSDILSFLALAIVTPIVALLIQLAISRQREYIADATGARIINNPQALANALKKLEAGNQSHPMRTSNTAASSLFIVNPFRGSAFAALLSTHPPMKERIRRLNAL